MECRSELPALKNRTEMELKIASEELRKQTQNSAKNRVIKAQERAKFLTRAAQTEKMLVQREYEEEMRPQLVVLCGGMAEPAKTDIHQSDGALTTVTDEELEAISKSFIISDMGSEGGN